MRSREASVSRAQRWLARGAVAGTALALSLWCALWMHSWVLELPPELQEAPDTSSRILDRDGRLLARSMADGQVFRATTTLADAGPHLPQALVAAEDARFFRHPGVDLASVVRALAQAAWHGRLVSGASTLTQQLARQTFHRPRTLAGKWQEMALALAIERRLSKEQILELYLGQVHFGSNLVGAAAAAEHYFGKPLRALDLSEAATLAGLVRGPSLFDPRRHPERARAERDRVLRRMREEGLLSPQREARARSLPVALHPSPPLPGAHHWVRVVQKMSQGEQVRTTLDGPLQREVESLVTEHGRRLHSATAASAVVLDNATGEVLAYVGSPDFDRVEEGGQNDGVQALRQPGSTLKPLIYAQAIDELRLTPASLLPDSPRHFATTTGYYAPRNYDRRFRGNVRLRRALANSLNVPAVFTVQKLGVDRTLQRLRSLGLRSLQASAEHYGPALALGDGEVTLLELTSSYATLARGGRPLQPRFLNPGASDPGRGKAEGVAGQAQDDGTLALSPTACALVLEMLSDDAARREAFGSANALDLPFPVAVKTGTSKGHRDSWTVGTTRELSVGVWVGNFDGRPTDHLSGAVGAGPLFHRIIEAAVAARDRAGKAVGAPLHDVPLEQARICVSSGRLADSEPCAHTMLEWFPPGTLSEPDSVGSQAPSHRETPTAPWTSELAPAGARIAFPRPGMVFELDPALQSQQQRLLIQTRGESALELTLDGAVLHSGQQTAEWPLQVGKHRLEACSAATQSAQEEDSARCEVVEFTVRARG